MVTFLAEKISGHVIRIHGIAGELMYLVEGTDRAALIDTGSGIGSLKEKVDSLTDKPYFILLTHGHVDHAMGAPEFDSEIYMNPADDKVHEGHCGFKMRKDSLLVVSQEIVEKIEENDYIPVRTGKYLTLSDGDCFDLGGVTLEIYACPGHTPGSMAILIKEERTLLLGDACNFFTFLFNEFCLSVEEFREQLLKFRERTDGLYDRVYFSHGSGDGPKEIVGAVISVCDDILCGNVDDVPFEFMGEHGYIAKAVTQEMERVDGGLGNIVYRK